MEKLRKLKGRLRSERGASDLVTFLMVVGIFVGLMFTTIDAAIYFNNRTAVQSVARDAARSVAIFGGNGTPGMATPLEAAYGTSSSAACGGIEAELAAAQADDRVDASVLDSSGYTPIECNALSSLLHNSSLISVKIYEVKCTPEITGAIDEEVRCDIAWLYNSIPASGLTAIKKAPDKDMPASLAGQNGLLASNLTRATAKSEVNLLGVEMKGRDGDGYFDDIEGAGGAGPSYRPSGSGGAGR